MSENPQVYHSLMTEPTKEENAMDTVACTLLKDQARSKILIEPGKNYQDLYKDIKSVLSDFDNSIGDCKKYNEAKIHRKYERKIADLEKQNKNLRDRIKQLQNAQSPSKSYVTDLVNQLVFLRSHNEKLESEVKILAALRQQNEAVGSDGKQPEGTFAPKARQHQWLQNSGREVYNLSLLGKQLNLKVEISNYLKQKQFERRITDEQRTEFQQFLKKVLPKSDRLSFKELLGEIDRWNSEPSNQKKTLERLKSNVLTTLQDEILSRKLPRISRELSPQSPYTSIQMGAKSHRNPISYKKRLNYSTLEVKNRPRDNITLK